MVTYGIVLVSHRKRHLRACQRLAPEALLSRPKRGPAGTGAASQPGSREPKEKERLLKTRWLT